MMELELNAETLSALQATRYAAKPGDVYRARVDGVSVIVSRKSDLWDVVVARGENDAHWITATCYHRSFGAAGHRAFTYALNWVARLHNGY